MKCPNCGHEQADGLAECEACQIIFAKWEEKKRRAADEAPRAAQGGNEDSEADLDPKERELMQFVALAGGEISFQVHDRVEKELGGYPDSDKFRAALLTSSFLAALLLRGQIERSGDRQAVLDVYMEGVKMFLDTDFGD